MTSDDLRLGQESVRAIARRFGISQSTAREIVHGLIWRHLVEVTS